jgi:hypothetical protein
MDGPPPVLLDLLFFIQSMTLALRTLYTDLNPPCLPAQHGKYPSLECTMLFNVNMITGHPAARLLLGTHHQRNPIDDSTLAKLPSLPIVTSADPSHIELSDCISLSHNVKP